eukprot:1148595-Pelagomonas_calceolata.AAC.1
MLHLMSLCLILRCCCCCLTCRGPLRRKRRGGGERKRKAKHAVAGREAREARHRHEDERSARGGAPGLFGFLNQALGGSVCETRKM